MAAVSDGETSPLRTAMRWAFINPMKGESWGGLENWMVRLCTGLKGKGDECFVIARRNSRWPEACDGCGSVFVPYRFGGDFDPVAILNLGQRLRRIGPDAVCVKGFRQARATRWGAPSLPVAIKLPLPRDVTGAFADRVAVRWCIERIIVDSFARRDALLEYPWVRKGSVVTVHNGIDAALLQPDAGVRHSVRAELGIDERAVLVAAAGRFEASKRYGDVLRAFREAGSGAAALLLVGDGPERSALASLAGELGLGARVRFLGWRSDLHRLLRACDLFVHPSSSEGFPNAVLEAMALGLAVVATRAGGTPELVQAESNGLLTDIGDVAAIASGLGRLCGDASLRKRLGAAAREHVVSRFTEARMVDGVRAVLVESIEARRRRG
jgi:glycosyltransferase involved in cell wall biosynthesis